MNKDIQFELTSSNYVNKKYTEFYKKHGYIPKMFNSYNCSEITDIAPTLTTQCGSMTSSSSICIIEEIPQKKDVYGE
mgnify:FL=1